MNSNVKQNKAGFKMYHIFYTETYVKIEQFLKETQQIKIWVMILILHVDPIDWFG